MTAESRAGSIHLVRCPHCASLRVAPPVCLLCGMRLDAPALQPVLPGLEVTREEGPGEVETEALPGLETTELGGARAAQVEEGSLPPVEIEEGRHEPEDDVPIVPMPGLITNAEVLGESSVAESEDPPRQLTHCPRCRADAGDERFCPRCGHAMPAMSSGDEEAPNLLCLDCGVPNPPDRQRCAACGKPL